MEQQEVQIAVGHHSDGVVEFWWVEVNGLRVGGYYATREAAEELAARLRVGEGLAT